MSSSCPPPSRVMCSIHAVCHWNSYLHTLKVVIGYHSRLSSCFSDMHERIAYFSHIDVRRSPISTGIIHLHHGVRQSVTTLIQQMLHPLVLRFVELMVENRGKLI
eukprot:TRINITY_DN3875_c0_g1_i3.p1 TRINITY_DN3875_c0_g1~~TRINITY_DN3875_c0_g1_i3.p1  ORF type:complete len:105 (-),score=6.20 TRINITY_DN3875_c0_g1_i3:7-321(-)